MGTFEGGPSAFQLNGPVSGGSGLLQLGTGLEGVEPPSHARAAGKVPFDDLAPAMQWAEA
jgi:hypothetical protein